MVPLKELQEAGLSAGGPLHSPETQVVSGSLQVAHVHGQVLQPQTRPLPHSGELRRPVQTSKVVDLLRKEFIQMCFLTYW